MKLVLALTEPFLLHYFERSLCDADRFILLLFDLLFSPSILKQWSCFTALFDFIPPLFMMFLCVLFLRADVLY